MDSSFCSTLPSFLTASSTWNTFSRTSTGASAGSNPTPPNNLSISPSDMLSLSGATLSSIFLLSAVGLFNTACTALSVLAKAAGIFLVDIPIILSIRFCLLSFVSSSNSFCDCSLNCSAVCMSSMKLRKSPCCSAGSASRMSLMICFCRVLTSFSVNTRPAIVPAMKPLTLLCKALMFCFFCEKGANACLTADFSRVMCSSPSFSAMSPASSVSSSSSTIAFSLATCSKTPDSLADFTNSRIASS